MSFIADSYITDFFRKRKFLLTEKEREYISAILINAHTVFKSPLNDPYLKKLEKVENSSLESELLILLNLELLLTNIYARHNLSAKTKQHKNYDTIQFRSYTKSNYDKTQIQKTITYFEQNISSDISVRDVCQNVNISYSTLKRLFIYFYNTTPMSYFHFLRIEKAKEYIRSTSLNLSQIAEKLGYSSIHYFSRQFKKITRMSPSEYATSIIAKSQSSEQADLLSYTYLADT